MQIHDMISVFTTSESIDGRRDKKNCNKIRKCLYSNEIENILDIISTGLKTRMILKCINLPLQKNSPGNHVKLCNIFALVKCRGVNFTCERKNLKFHDANGMMFGCPWKIKP